MNSLLASPLDTLSPRGTARPTSSSTAATCTASCVTRPQRRASTFARTSASPRSTLTPWPSVATSSARSSAPVWCWVRTAWPQGSGARSRPTNRWPRGVAYRGTHPMEQARCLASWLTWSLGRGGHATSCSTPCGRAKRCTRWRLPVTCLPARRGESGTRGTRRGLCRLIPAPHHAHLPVAGPALADVGQGSDRGLVTRPVLLTGDPRTLCSSTSRKVLARPSRTPARCPGPPNRTSWSTVVHIRGRGRAINDFVNERAPRAAVSSAPPYVGRGVGPRRRSAPAPQ